MSELPSPRSLGLAISSWREQQPDAIEWLNSRSAPAMILEGPTGVGKSAIALAALLTETSRSGGIGYYLTATKRLQTQLLGTYPDLNVLKGQNAYDCLINPTLSVEEARCHAGFKCPQKGVCDYFVARSEAARAPVTAINYAYYLTERRFVGKLPAPTILLCDEAHNVERELMGSVSITISDREVLRLQVPPPPKSLDGARTWANRNIGSIDSRLIDLQLLKEKLGELPEKEDKLRRRLKSLYTAMDKLLNTEADPENWVLEDISRGIEVRPILVDRYAKSLLWSGAGRIVLTSATLPKHDYFARIVGLPRWEAMILDSPFPVENRPILIDPISQPLNKSTEYPGSPAWTEMVEQIDRIYDHWPDAKGFIHAVSYARAQEIYQNSRHRHRMVVPGDAKTKDAVLQTWKARRSGSILVSPSVWEGIDEGADEHNAVQVLPKLYYPYLGSPQVKARLDADPDWAPFQSSLFLVQATGRGNRHTSDSCISYITDPAITRHLNRHDQFLPNWWKQALRFRPGKAA